MHNIKFKHECRLHFSRSFSFLLDANNSSYIDMEVEDQAEDTPFDKSDKLMNWNPLGKNQYTRCRRCFS
jgi:hypothetical protein